MSDDLVTRLRNVELITLMDYPELTDLTAEAADYIERLRSRGDELALLLWCSTDSSPDYAAINTWDETRRG